MPCQSSFVIIPLMMLPLATIAVAHDASKYPNLKGQWTIIITPGLEGQAVKFDPTKPWGRGQEAPLTAAYQKIHEDSMADQANGGLGNYPTATCHPGGMPRTMSIGEYEYIVEPETTYILIGGEDHYRRIFTDGRPWPAEIAPSLRATRSEDGSTRTAAAASMCWKSKHEAHSRGRELTTRPGYPCISTTSRSSKSASFSTRPTRIFFMT